MATVNPRMSQGPVISPLDGIHSEANDVFGVMKPLSSQQGSAQSNYVFDLNAMSSVSVQGYSNLDEVVGKITDSYMLQNAEVREQIEKTQPDRSAIGVDVQLQREVQSILHKLMKTNSSLASCLQHNDCELQASYATITNVAPGEHHLRVGERHYSAGFIANGELTVETLQPLTFEVQTIKMMQDAGAASVNGFLAPTCADDNPLLRRLHAGDSVGSLSQFHGLKSRATYYVEDVESTTEHQSLPDESNVQNGTNILLFSYEALNALASLSPLVFNRLMHAFAVEAMNEINQSVTNSDSNKMCASDKNTTASQQQQDQAVPASHWGWASTPSCIPEEPETPQSALPSSRFHDELNLNRFASYALTVTPYQKKEAASLVSPSNAVPSTSRFNARSTRHNNGSAAAIHSRGDQPHEFDSFLCLGEWDCIKEFLTKVRSDQIMCSAPSSGVPLYITSQPLAAATTLQQWFQGAGAAYAQHLDAQLSTGKGKYSSVFGFQEGSKSQFQPVTPMSTTNNSAGGNNSVDYASKGVPMALVPCLPPILKKQQATVQLQAPSTLTITALFPTVQPSARVTAHIARAAYRFVVALLARRCSIAEGGLRVGFSQMSSHDVMQSQLTQQIKDLQHELDALKQDIVEKQKLEAVNAVERAQQQLHESGAKEHAQDQKTNKTNKQLEQEEKKDVEMIKGLFFVNPKKDAASDQKNSNKRDNDQNNATRSKDPKSSANDSNTNTSQTRGIAFIPRKNTEKDKSDTSQSQSNGNNDEYSHINGKDLYLAMESTMVAERMNALKSQVKKDERNNDDVMHDGLVVVSVDDNDGSNDKNNNGGVQSGNNTDKTANAIANSSSPLHSLNYEDKLDLFNPQNVMNVRLEALRRSLLALDTLKSSPECRNNPEFARQVAKAQVELAQEAQRLEQGIAKLTVRNQKQDIQRLLRIIAAVCGKGLIERRRVTKQLYDMHVLFAKSTAAAADAVALCYQNTLGNVPTEIILDEELMASNGSNSAGVTDNKTPMKKKGNVVVGNNNGKTPRKGSVANNNNNNNNSSSSSNINSGANTSAATSTTTSNNTIGTSNISNSDISEAQKRKEKLDLLTLTAHALVDSINIAQKGGDITVPKSELHTNAFEHDSSVPASDAFICSIRNAEGRLVKVMTIPRHWDTPDPALDEQENQMRMKVFEDMLTEQLPEGYTRVLQNKDDGNPLLPARCLQYWLGPDGIATDSAKAAEYALNGNAQDYATLAVDSNSGSSSSSMKSISSGNNDKLQDKNNSRKISNNNKSTPAKSNKKSSSNHATNSMKTTKKSNVVYHNPDEVRSNPAYLNEALGNLLEAQLFISSAVYLEAQQISQDLREKTRQLSALLKKEREKRTKMQLEMENQANNSEALVALRDEMNQMYKEREMEAAQKELLAQEYDESRQKSLRGFKEEKEELKKKLKAAEENMRKTRVESDKCREDEHRIREKLIEYERGRQKERDEYRKMEKRVEHCERDLTVKQSDCEDQEQRIAQLTRNGHHGGGGHHNGAELNKDEEEQLMRQRVVLEEENRALTKRAHHQRKQISEGREQLAVLAAKERDLMAAIDSLRLAHTAMLGRNTKAPLQQQPPQQHFRSREGSAQSGRHGLPAAGSQIMNQQGPRAPYSHFLPPLQTE